MSTIRILIYTLDKYTFQTRITSFLDHEKSLKEAKVVRLALFMNDNAKNPQMEHCLCPKYYMSIGFTCAIYRSEKDI